MDVDELIAREEIRDVVKRLARGTDRLDEEMIVSCYHPDGHDDHNSFRGGPVEFARWVSEVLGQFDATHHLVGDPNMQISGDVAQVDTYCNAHHVSADRDLIISLRYVDRFERREGRWLIARRVCAFDWTYTVPIDGAMTFRFGPDFTVGHRDRTDITYPEVR